MPRTERTRTPERRPSRLARVDWEPVVPSDDQESSPAIVRPLSGSGGGSRTEVGVHAISGRPGRRFLITEYCTGPRMATAPRFARSEGPGEMSEAFGIVVLADGDIMVAGRQRDLFSSEGIYLESHAPGPGSDRGALTLDRDASPSGRWIVTHEFTLYPEPWVQLRVYDHEMRNSPPLERCGCDLGYGTLAGVGRGEFDTPTAKVSEARASILDRTR